VRVLRPIDARRADPQYRAGFSDEAQGRPLSSSPDTASGGDVGRYATVSTINLNLRTGAGPDYDSVAVMPQGTTVKIVRDADDGWKELEIQGANGQDLHGFANGTFLAPVAPSYKPAERTDLNKLGSGQELCVAVRHCRT
jgi:hypothetical protein